MNKKVNMYRELRQLIAWVAKNAACEPPCINPIGEAWNINAHELLDQISELFNIPKDAISGIVEEEIKR